MWNDRYSVIGLSLAGRAVFDPTGGILTAGLTLAGGAAAAAGTLAGGSYAKQAGQMQQAGAEFQAEQVEQNATQAIASGQRQMLDTQQRTRLAMSTSTARAGASGVDAGVGSPVENVGALGQRGAYQARMDLFNGQSKATGLLNEAAGIRYTGQMERIGGEEAQEASYLTAAGTLAGAAGNSFKAYGTKGSGY